MTRFTTEEPTRIDSALGSTDLECDNVLCKLHMIALVKGKSQYSHKFPERIMGFGMGGGRAFLSSSILKRLKVYIQVKLAHYNKFIIHERKTGKKNPRDAYQFLPVHYEEENMIFRDMIAIKRVHYIGIFEKISFYETIIFNV